MGRKKIYNDNTEKKAALALAKKLKRSSEKELKKVQESNFQWISQYLDEVADQVTQKVERKIADAKRRKLKRFAIKEADNISPKRQKYTK